MKKFFNNLKTKFSNLLCKKDAAERQIDFDEEWDCEENFDADVNDLTGCVPERLTSGTAQTLEALLTGKRINCMTASKGAFSTRLKDHIASLRKNYYWSFIESEYTTVLTKDGRLQRVMEYWLPQNVIKTAEAEGAKQWCMDVRAACRERKRLLQVAKPAHEVA